MAGISRATQVIFGSTGLVPTGGFGAPAAGNVATEVATSSTIATITGTAAWLQGWLDATIGASKFPTIEDMNAAFYSITTNLAYTLERGIPEYDAGTTYNANDICRSIGGLELYASVGNANTGNAVSNATYWTDLGSLANLNSSNFFTGGTTTGSASAQVLASTLPTSGFSLSTNGQLLSFTAGYAPTGATTLQITSPAIAATAIKKPSTSGLVALTGNEWTAGETVLLAVNTTAACYELVDASALFLQSSNNLNDVASAATALSNLGGAGVHAVVGNTTQAYTDETASRAIGTTYTNSTGAPIHINIEIATGASAGSYSATLTINSNLADASGLYLYTGGTNTQLKLTGIVGVGETYVVTSSSTTLTKWYERR